MPRFSSRALSPCSSFTSNSEPRGGFSASAASTPFDMSGPACRRSTMCNWVEQWPLLRPFFCGPSRTLREGDRAHEIPSRRPRAGATLLHCDLSEVVGRKTCGGICGRATCFPGRSLGITVSATVTAFGPRVCTQGHGFSPAGTVHVEYQGIPFTTQPTPANSSPIIVDGTGSFSMRDSVQRYLGPNCSNAQITQDVIVQATDDTIGATAKATIPGGYWCPNGVVSTNFNGGCP
jgi:hypothetical protein